VTVSGACGHQSGGNCRPPNQEVQVQVEEVPASQAASFWQTIKPFGWQGLPLVGVLLALYAPVLLILVDQWYRAPDYSHGFLVPLLSAYLIWARRDKRRQVPRRPSLWRMVVVFGALGLLVLGSLGAELFLARISLLCAICGLIVYFCGGAILRALAFPMAFLLR
jgi:transmembrane exosortase EpsH